jgi:dipeptidyl aminopeptidase/acylaminoacyl peptidase
MVSLAEPVSWRGQDGEPVHGFYSAPVSSAFRGPEGELPPLIVMSHGGPTGMSTPVFDSRLQFWTTRGIGVLSVNYRGSSGYGRAYRDRLRGSWGVVDVDDCASGATAMASMGRADPQRLAIRGGSAGGYTTLAALTFRDVFTAGASLFGVADLELLARDTHKFESRYLDGLVGPYPEARALYLERSPIHHVDQISCPMILLQGRDDPVVPLNQAQSMADAVRTKGLPIALIVFDGEGHGFRKAENVVRSYEAEAYFYSRVFGFDLADDVLPVEIENLAVPSA